MHISEKVYFRSQILGCPSIGEYWNISGVPVLPENVILTFFRKYWWHPEANNTRMKKWSSTVQYSCASIWDLKYTFSHISLGNGSTPNFRMIQKKGRGVKSTNTE